MRRKDLTIATILSAVLVCGVIFFKIYKDRVSILEFKGSFEAVEKLSPAKETPQLYTEGNQIKRKDTGKTVVLKGASSDAFRHKKGKYSDPNELFRRIGLLRKAGGNLITFWVTKDGFDTRVDLAEKVMDFAKENGLYVMWAPAEASQPNLNDKEREIMLKLALKFKDVANVILGLDAEPFEDWDLVVERGVKLGQEIRMINSEALLFLPGGLGGKHIEQKGEHRFPLSNTIFGTEEYLANNLSELKTLQNKKNHNEEYAWQDPSYSQFPVLVSEMGGVSSTDFGAPEDLEIIQRMLDDIEKRGFSYQMHSLDTYDTFSAEGIEHDISGLGMFDGSGNLNEKGKLFFDFLSKHPAGEKK